MKITSVKVKIISRETLRANISIVVDEVLFVDNIKVIYDNKKEKYFLAMPSIVDNIGKRHDVFHPIDADSRQRIEDFLMQFYEYANENKKSQIKMVLREKNRNTCVQKQSITEFWEKNDEIDINSDEQIFSITSFRIRIINSNSNLCAIASFVIDYGFAVENLKIVLDKYTNDYKLYMPQFETKAHNQKDLIHPVNRTFRGKLEELLLDSYKVLLEKEVRELSANVFKGQSKSLYMQTISDFDYEYAMQDKIPREAEIIEKKFSIADMTESIEEMIYRDPSCVIREIVKHDNKKYVSGKIVGYIDDNHYKVILFNGKIGNIECELMDSYDKVLDYSNKRFGKCTFSSNEKQEEKCFLKHINKDYYFEVIEERKDVDCALSIEKVRLDFLDYVIKHKCVLKGKIVQIDNGHVGIEVPFGFIFFTSIGFVFGCKYDSMFDYMNYIGAEISIIVSYEKETNKLYPKIANTTFNLLDNNISYIFPALTIWEKTYYSKLWLDRRLLLLDKNKKYPLKHINQLIVVGNLREKGEMQKIYKGNIKKIFSEKDAVKYRKNILAVEWMIDLKGYNIKTAIDYLERKGFSYTVQYSYSFEKERGIVLSMQPNIKEKIIIPRNVIIELTISQGRRKEYIMPDFVGMHIKEVRDILKNNKIALKYKVSNIETEGIRDNCIIQTWPSAGKILLSGKTVDVTIYQENNYESPFVLRENEYPRINYNSKIVGTENAINQFISVAWQKSILVFILKHKVVNSIHLKQWVEMHNYTEVSKLDINAALRYLQSMSMIGSVSLGSDVSDKTKIQFLFPLKNIYPIFRGCSRYRGMFSWYGKDVRYYKTRAAENQAFLKLYNILKNDYIINYEVDCIQRYTYDDLQQYLKVHIAVNASSKLENSRSVYFIEAIRFLNEEHILEGWEKLVRYNRYISKKYELTPYLLLVFEDEEHLKKFMMKKPLGFKFQHIELIYTWDRLTNTDSDKFDDVFTKEEMLC